jgi:putative nucleotidyltransferase-like protein
LGGGGSNAALDLRQAYRYEVLQAALREHQLIQSLKLLRSARIEPMLAKGLAVARLYPERGLRPYGDIDLYVFRRWQLGRGHIGTLPAAALLRRPAGLLKALRPRWPNPIQATVSLGGSFNELPRLPFQLGECMKRTSQFVARGEYFSTRLY